MATTTLGREAAAAPGAVAYACTRLGFRVFPLRRDIGTPAFTEWPDRATLDEDRIREWWTGEYQGCGVGIATGPESGLWVLDIDVKDADGFKSLRELMHSHEQTSAVFGRTMTVRTPSGGAHVYFRWDEASGTEGGVRNSSKQLAPGLDVRGIRGYVRAPGVGAYRIVERRGASSTVIECAPQWLTQLCKKRRTAPTDTGTNADVRARRARQQHSGWVLMQIDDAIRALRDAPAGTRNETLNRTAFRLGTLAHRSGITEAGAWAECRKIMLSIGAGDSEAAQRRTFDSGWRAGSAAANDSIYADEAADANAADSGKG